MNPTSWKKLDVSSYRLSFVLSDGLEIFVSDLVYVLELGLFCIFSSPPSLLGQMHAGLACSWNHHLLYEVEGKHCLFAFFHVLKRITLVNDEKKDANFLFLYSRILLNYDCWLFLLSSKLSRLLQNIYFIYTCTYVDMHLYI